MSSQSSPRKFSRRTLLKLGGVGGLSLLAGGALPAVAKRLDPPPLAGIAARPVAQASPPPVNMRLAATDGHVVFPGRGSNGVGTPVYIFGFRRAALSVPPSALDTFKGNVQLPAPIIGVDQEADVYLTVTNIGLVVRPDLDDSHTVHWHGFPNATAIFDGVPEVSIAVPVGRDFPYYYKPHRAGTFMYHCHFEDVEHVQMGMTGIVFVRPSQNGTPLGGFTRFAYNDGNGATGYTREFALLLNEIWTQPHDNLESIQETVWPNYKANYWLINGRSYPDTLALNGSVNPTTFELTAPPGRPDLQYQPISSLMQVNPGDRVLLRLSNLGYEQHSMQLPGIRLRVVGEDAALLRGPGGADLSYLTNTIYIGPGEARDVLFTAPAFNASAPSGTDGAGTYNVYLFNNRSPHKLTNGGAPGLGGMVTELRVYQGSPLPPQTTPNQTYP